MPSLHVGLIGAGIAASKSPMLHMTEGAAQGLDLHYHLMDVTARGIADPAAALPALLAEAEAEGFVGVNVTHPFKQWVIEYLDELSPDAALLGAVNTVVFERSGGKIRRIGHNTDWWGFMNGLRVQAPEANLEHVVQLGAGGAGVAVAHALWRMGVGQLSLFDPDQAKAEALATSLNARAEREVVRLIADPAAQMSVATGLVHCTPIGMAAHPGVPIDTRVFASYHFVADIVYFPLDTELLQAARKAGCMVIDGGGMAVYQAVEAFRLFTGRTADAHRMTDQFRRAISG